MKKFFQRVSVASILAVLSLFASTGLLSASAADDTHTIHIFEPLVNNKTVQVLPGPVQQGDYLVFYNPVFVDSTNTKQIGHASGSCFYTDTTTANTIFECSWSVTLPGGSISLEGTQYANDPNSLHSVTGGTGAYRLARGEAKLFNFQLPSGITEIEYHIQLG